MVRDAEIHADEDRKFHELVSVRNQADGLLHATRKSLEELGEKVEAGERRDIELAIDDLKSVLSGDDKEAIETRAQKLAEVSGKVAQRANQADAGAGGAPGREPGRADANADDNVVDADFEEVDHKK